MKHLLLLLLLAAPAFADDCPICRCTLVERDPAWVPLHDAWWSCNVAEHEQQREYARCLGAIREREAMLTRRQRKHYVPFVENPGVFAYVFPQHPTEDRINQIEESQAQVTACEVQLGADFLPEVLRCSAHLQNLRGRR